MRSRFDYHLQMTDAKRFKARWIGFPFLLLLVLFLWVTDRVTLQGERTIYTINCLNGVWNGNQCGGQIAVGPRYRYRALKNRGEVLFWVLGTSEPSYKLTGCTIQDGRNWTCPENADSTKSLTLSMRQGEPQRNPAWQTLQFHSTSKPSWLLLDFGFTKVFDID